MTVERIQEIISVNTQRSLLTRAGFALSTRRAGIITLLAGASAILVGVAPMQDDTGFDASVADTRGIMEQWVETRKVISKERQEWREDREILNDRIQIITQEIESVREDVTETTAEIEELESSFTTIQGKNEQLKESASALEEVVVTLENRTRELLKYLPETLRDAVRPLSQSLPDDSTETDQGLSQRFQNVAGILSLMNKFNREISISTGVRALPDGSSVQVTSMYVGLGQGYYVNDDQTIAGVGRPGPEGFIWTPANDKAMTIARAIAILQNEVAAEFVQLPVVIDDKDMDAK